jgi:hypothetical protein
MPYVQDFALADLRPPHDHLQDPRIFRRPADFVEPGLEFARRQMLHRLHY